MSRRRGFPHMGGFYARERVLKAGEVESLLGQSIDRERLEAAEAARAACKLEHVRLHDLRHTAASEMVAAGVDLGAVGAVLGHKSTATTRRYAHYGVQRLADALRKRG